MLGGLLLLGACAGSAGTEAPAAAAPPPPTDPVAAFAAQASPGSQSRITLADGRPAAVRMNRAYIAASGRECREVQVGTSTAQRAQLVCQSENGAWVQARPLLRGGGFVR